MISLHFPLVSVALLVSAMARAGAQDAVAHYKLGRAAYAAHDAAIAVKEFDKAASLDGKNADYHLWLARSIGLESENASLLRVPSLAKRMRTEYERTVALDSMNLGGHEGLVEVYLGPAMFGGSVVKAQQEADAMSRINGLRGHIARATIARHEKDSAAVEREWRAAASEFPDSIVAASGYADLLVLLRRSANAVDVIDQFTKRRPADLRGTYAFGRIAAISGLQMERGEQALRSVLAAPAIGVDPALPPPANAHYWLGEILRLRGLTAQAREEYQRALALDPNLIIAKKALGELPRFETY